MRTALPLFSLLLGLCACGDDELTFCDRWAASTSWSAVDRTTYQAAAITGTVTLVNGQRQTYRDDRGDSRIRLDRGSIDHLDLEMSGPNQPEAVLRLRAPEQEGTFALDLYEAELGFCDDGASLGWGWGGLAERGCAREGTVSPVRIVPLHGTLVVSPKPGVEIDDVRDYAYAFRIDGTSDDGMAVVALEVLAFASYSVDSGKECGEGK